MFCQYGLNVRNLYACGTLAAINTRNTESLEAKLASDRQLDHMTKLSSIQTPGTHTELRTDIR